MTPSAPDVQIDRIDIRVPGVERDAARRLAQLVAGGLAGELRLGPGEAAVERLDLELTAEPGEQPEALAARIAAQISLLIANTRATEAGR